MFSSTIQVDAKGIMVVHAARRVNVMDPVVANGVMSTGFPQADAACIIAILEQTIDVVVTNGIVVSSIEVPIVLVSNRNVSELRILAIQPAVPLDADSVSRHAVDQVVLNDIVAALVKVNPRCIPNDLPATMDVVVGD